MSRRAIAALVMLVAVPVAGDYRQSYADGVKALDTGNWAAAVEHLQQAAAEQPREGERVTVDELRDEPYLPHFQLGRALVSGGDCPGALAAFAASERQGAVQETERWSELQRLRAACQSPPSPARPVPPARDALPEGEAPPRLRQASLAFLGGDYPRVVELLDGPRLPERRAAALAALLRAAARHALFLEAESGAEVVPEAIRHDIVACRSLDAHVVPDTTFFSPAFVALFGETR